MAVAISVVPVVAMILILLSRRAKANSLALLLGWVAGLSAVTVAVYIFAAGADLKPQDSLSTVSSIIGLALGVFFLGVAAFYWFRRPGEGEEPRMPAWLSLIDRLKPVTSFIVGVVFGVFNMKNLPLTMMAAVTVARGHLGVAGTVLAFTVYITVASAGLIVPAAVYLVAGERASEPLESVKAWLIRNNATVMMVVFLFLAVLLIGKSTAELAG